MQYRIVITRCCLIGVGWDCAVISVHHATYHVFLCGLKASQQEMDSTLELIRTYGKASHALTKPEVRTCQRLCEVAQEASELAASTLIFLACEITSERRAKNIHWSRGKPAKQTYIRRAKNS